LKYGLFKYRLFVSDISPAASTMDILTKRPNLIFLIAIRMNWRKKIFCLNRSTCPTELYRKLLCTELRRDIYWKKWQKIKVFLETEQDRMDDLLTTAIAINKMLEWSGMEKFKYS